MFTRSRRLLTAGLALVTASLVLTSARGQPPPPPKAHQLVTPEVQTVVVRAGFNATAYEKALSGLVAEELMVQRAWRNQGVTVVPPGDNTPHGAQEIDFRWLADGAREVRSDFLLMKSHLGDEWLAFRDVFQVDGKPVRAREERLQNLAVHTPAVAAQRAASVAAESARYHVGFLVRNVHLPTVPLRLLGSSRRANVEFRKMREMKIGDVTAWELAFAERGSPTVVRDGGKDIPATGTFWLAPATGQVLRTTMKLEVNGVTAELTVTYRRAEQPGEAWAPTEIRQTYLSLRQRLECAATYSKIRPFPAVTQQVR